MDQIHPPLVVWNSKTNLNEGDARECIDEDQSSDLAVQAESTGDDGVLVIEATTENNDAYENVIVMSKEDVNLELTTPSQDDQAGIPDSQVGTPAGTDQDNKVHAQALDGDTSSGAMDGSGCRFDNKTANEEKTAKLADFFGIPGADSGDLVDKGAVQASGGETPEEVAQNLVASLLMDEANNYFFIPQDFPGKISGVFSFFKKESSD